MARNQVIRYVIVADDQATKNLDRTAQATEGISKKMGGLAAAAGAYLAVKALGAVKDFVGDSIRAYSDLNESLNALEVTFGENAEGIKALGREAAGNLGLSNAEFNSFAVSISAFAQQIAGDSGDVVGTVDEMTTRVSDFASVMNLDVADAATKFQSGLAGQTEPLRQFGIDVSAAKVEAYALANGIWDGNDAMTESEKVQARYRTIMEQTDQVAGDFASTSDELANQTRITNARIENQKAIVGETLQVYGEWGNVAKGLMSEALAVLAIGIQEVTGKLTEGEAALQNYRIATGDTTTGIEGVVRAWSDLETQAADTGFFEDLFSNAPEDAHRMRRELEDLIASAGYTREELEDLASKGVHVLMEEFGLSQENAELLAGVLDEELAEAGRKAYDEIKYGGAILNATTTSTEELTEATEDFTESAYDQVEALDNLRDAKRRNIDATFNLIESNREVKEAQDEYNAAVEEFGPKSDEAIEAGANLYGAQQDLIDAALTFKDEAGPNWEEGFRQQMESAGVSAETIQEIIDKVKGLDGAIADVNGREINLTAKVTAPRFIYRQEPNGTAYPKTTGYVAMAHGGIVTDPTLGMIGEAGSDEAIIPLDAQGARFMAGVIEEALGRINGNGGGLTVHYHGPVIGLENVERTVAEIVERARRKGIAI